jgi:hypothetical protein
MTFSVQFALVFFSLVAVDTCWTLYIAKVNEGKALAAATWSAAIMACGAFASISYIHDNRLLVAAVLGGWVGTYGTVRFNKWRQSRKEPA